MGKRKRGRPPASEERVGPTPETLAKLLAHGPDPFQGWDALHQRAACRIFLGFRVIDGATQEATSRFEQRSRGHREWSDYDEKVGNDYGDWLALIPRGWPIGAIKAVILEGTRYKDAYQLYSLPNDFDLAGCIRWCLDRYCEVWLRKKAA